MPIFARDSTKRPLKNSTFSQDNEITKNKKTNSLADMAKSQNSKRYEEAEINVKACKITEAFPKNQLKKITNVKTRHLDNSVLTKLQNLNLVTRKPLSITEIQNDGEAAIKSNEIVENGKSEQKTCRKLKKDDIRKQKDTKDYVYKFYRVCIDSRPFGLTKKIKPSIYQSYTKYVRHFAKLILFEMKAQIFQKKEKPEGPIYSGKLKSLRKRRVIIKLDTDEFDPVYYYSYVQIIYQDIETKENAFFYGLVIKCRRKRKTGRVVVTLVTEKTIKNLMKDDLLTYHVVCRVGTSLREYEAIHNLGTSTFKNIITGKQGRIIYNDVAKETIKKYQESFGLNKWQSKAVSVSLDPNNPYVLIQGPPGTGKSSTIVAIITSLFSNCGKVKPHVLVCAPSNYAVDHLCQRTIKILKAQKLNKNLTILRYGVEERIDPYLHKYTLQGHLNSLGYVYKDHLGNRLFYPGNEIREQKIRTIKSAHLLFCTLSSSSLNIIGHPTNKYDYIIVDESTQSVEPSTLIPLKHFSKKFILIGDDKQLPPTVISDNLDLKKSLFERSREFCDPILLREQLRMSEELIYLPNHLFYDGRLKTSRSVESRKNPCEFLKQMYFVNVDGSEEPNNEMSFFNYKEADCVVDFLLYLRSKNVKYENIGIISPYKGQVACIEQELLKMLYKDQNNSNKNKENGSAPDKDLVLPLELKINTVDAFQGQEKNLIILSTVRTKKLGFITDSRRLNVSITRAKFTCVIFGNADILVNDENWGSLISHYKDTGNFVQESDFFSNLC